MTESAINAGLARDSAASGVPEMSVVIACYNDWRPLHQCLQSLAEQSGAPAFEVIVVDDGSRQTTPDFIAAWTAHLSLKILRQPHAGISAARNHGVQSSRGEVVVFVDADCKLQKHCLAVLAAVIVDHPQRNYFQLRLIGDCSRLVGRAEELRLIIIQQHMLLADGCIRYLNTAGFAIRREHTDLDGGVFDPAAQRAEDTLFLANLMQGGELPFFVENAIVQHAIPLNLAQCLAKDVRSALLEARTYDVIAAKGVKFRVSHRERLSLLRLMWATSAQRSIGRAAWFVLATRQALRLVILRALDWSGRRFEPRVEAKSS